MKSGQSVGARPKPKKNSQKIHKTQAPVCSSFARTCAYSFFGNY
jgi:hypothetical protein